MSMSGKVLDAVDQALLDVVEVADCGARCPYRFFC